MPEPAAVAADAATAADAASAGVVVVGAGLAGARTCQELRAAGHQGPITLIGDEAASPYDRPPLSKQAVDATTGDLGFDAVALNVDFRPDLRVTGLAGASRTADGPLQLAVAGHAPVLAEAVVVATGASPIVPPGWHLGDRVRTLRTRDDAIALATLVDALGAQARFAVLGGSWIGMELASRLAAAGIAVTVLEKAAWLLPQLPPEVGRQVRRWCDGAGVEVGLGLPVDGVTIGEAPRDGVVVATTGGGEVVADAALVALGVRPATGWLADSGLGLSPRSGALRVDQHLRSGDPRVIGVGDAVERWSPRYRAWLPGGHWQDALDAPVVAAQSVLAALAVTGPPPPAAYDAVPYFWSEMFGHTLQWTGFLTDYRSARLVVRGDMADGPWSVCWLDEHARLHGVLACDRPRDAVAARKAQAADPGGAPEVDIDALADPQRAMRDCFVAGR